MGIFLIRKILLKPPAIIMVPMPWLKLKCLPLPKKIYTGTTITNNSKENASFIFNKSNIKKFEKVSIIDAKNGVPKAHGSTVMHKGALAVIYSEDSGKCCGGFSFMNIKDPSNPKLNEFLPAASYGVSSWTS